MQISCLDVNSAKKLLRNVLSASLVTASLMVVFNVSSVLMQGNWMFIVLLWVSEKAYLYWSIHITVRKTTFNSGGGDMASDIPKKKALPSSR